jgi:hypothetical protein
MAIKLENIDITGFELYEYPLPLGDLIPKLGPLANAISAGEIQKLQVVPGSSVQQLLPEKYHEDIYKDHYVILIKK